MNLSDPRKVIEGVIVGAFEPRVAASSSAVAPVASSASTLAPAPRFRWTNLCAANWPTLDGPGHDAP